MANNTVLIQAPIVVQEAIKDAIAYRDGIIGALALLRIMRKAHLCSHELHDLYFDLGVDAALCGDIDDSNLFFMICAAMKGNSNV